MAVKGNFFDWSSDQHSISSLKSTVKKQLKIEYAALTYYS